MLDDSPLPQSNTHTGSVDLPAEASGYAFAPHYYDAMQLLLKDFYPWVAIDSSRERIVVGQENVLAAHRGALRKLRTRDFVVRAANV